jgi:hypothetical protein
MIPIVYSYAALVISGLFTGLTPGDAQAAPPPPGDTSINSTSQNRTPAEGKPSTAVSEQQIVPNLLYSVFAINDLGMHCGDLDTRIVSILPPFNVLHAQVIEKGREPSLLRGGPEGTVDVFYSAASSPHDPVLGTSNPPGFDFAGVYKTNFWDSLNLGAYNPFYPLDIVPPSILVDLGLPTPDPALLPALEIAQQAMPGIAGPYVRNDPQGFARFDTDLQFFSHFPFGYEVVGLNWFSADGIPITTVDDFGRLNPYPLMRVQAIDRASNSVLTTVDTVLPVSGEANCRNCHTAEEDNDVLGGDGSATVDLTAAGLPVASALDDPAYGSLPLAVSVEYAADLNILRLHDLKHGATYVDSTGTATPCTLDSTQPDGDANCLTHQALNQQPVVCQVCHYTPALDLAQVGPLGGSPLYPDNSGITNANGRVQRVNKTMSRVMHDFHGDIAPLNTVMPPPDQPRDADTLLLQTCYQCHPGENTQCLRGVMASGGSVCQDCHGDMKQVGNDFSIDLAVDSPFPDAADLTRRIPWAHEPGCQSCHTGDAVSLNHPVDAIVAPDGIRLLQAWTEVTLSDGSTLAQPIESPNSRFAEDQTPAGQRILYRLSTGHGGVFCQACHGSTHAEWPVQPDYTGPWPPPPGTLTANDNVTAGQLQGHTGTIIECSTCHTGDLGNTLGGPHGMHPVGASTFVNGGHEDLAEDNLQQCAVCHGLSGEGTVLSKAAVTRTGLRDAPKGTITAGTLVDCGICHENPFTEADD